MSHSKHQFQDLYDILEANLPTLFPLVKNYTSDECLKELQEYLAHGEYGLVYEGFCDVIFFYKIPITQETFDLIEKLGKLMKYENPLWEELKEFIIKQPN